MKKIVAILLFFVCAFTLSAQDISSALRQAQGRFDSGNESGAIEILTNILQKYPDNKEAKELYDKINQIINDRTINDAWTETTKQNTFESYKKFREKYPNSKYDDLASDNMAKRLADKFNELSTYDDRKLADSYVKKQMTKDYVSNKWKHAKVSSQDNTISNKDVVIKDLLDATNDTENQTESVTQKAETPIKAVPEKKKKQEYSARQRYKNKSVFYLGATYDISNFSSLSICVGGFIYRVNLEAIYSYPIQVSTRIYWNYPDDMTEPSVYDYTPQYYGGKVGYGFSVKNRFRFTPQIGSGILTLNGACIEANYNDPLAISAYSIPVKCELRTDISCFAPLTLTLKAGYSYPIYKSDLYKLLSSGSQTIESYVNGFTCGMGVCLFF